MMLDEQTLQALIAKAVKGDQRALNRLLHAYQDDLLRYIASRMGDGLPRVISAEDIL